MTENDPTSPGSSDSEEQLLRSVRKNCGVRFFDPEWEEMKQAAQSLGVTPAEFVRERTLDLVRNPSAADSLPIPSNLAPLIERTFRYTYMLATRMRDEMDEGGLAAELDQLINEARELQDSLLKGVAK